MLGGVWRRLTRFSLTRGRLTRRRLDAFVSAYASDGPALIVHSDDIDYARHFPNGFRVSRRSDRPADLHADPHYATLGQLPDESRDLIVCTGLLEHLPDPSAVIRELARILQPGGRLLLSASGVFSYHGAPENYFHFTPDGMRKLLGNRLHLVELRGSTGPFETLGVLAQRINLQCDIFPPIRLLTEAMVHVLPWFDVFVLRQYSSPSRIRLAEDTVGIMPATLMAVAEKPAKG